MGRVKKGGILGPLLEPMGGGLPGGSAIVHSWWYRELEFCLNVSHLHADAFMSTVDRWALSFH